MTNILNITDEINQKIKSSNDRVAMEEEIIAVAMAGQWATIEELQKLTGMPTPMLFLDNRFWMGLEKGAGWSYSDDIVNNPAFSEQQKQVILKTPLWTLYGMMFHEWNLKHNYVKALEQLCKWCKIDFSKPINPMDPRGPII